MKNVALILSMVVMLPACFYAKKESSDLIIINVLDKAEFDDCHIKGSIHIPFERLEQEAQRFNKDATIVVYCSNYQCTASKYGAQLLTSMGFTHVYAYEAGMAEWYQQGLPIVGSCTMNYLKEENKKVEDINNDVNIIETENLKEKVKQKLAVQLTS